MQTLSRGKAHTMQLHACGTGTQHGVQGWPGAGSKRGHRSDPCLDPNRLQLLHALPSLGNLFPRAWRAAASLARGRVGASPPAAPAPAPDALQQEKRNRNARFHI